MGVLCTETDCMDKMGYGILEAISLFRQKWPGHRM
jgi:hypothetical protein